MLRRVGLPDAELTFNKYPHQLSGGMCQRAMMAIALSCQPQLLIADEPTTALDVTTEAQVLHLIKDLQEELGMALIFITHNLGVVAEMADDIVVMYLGKVVEHTRRASPLRRPQTSLHAGAAALHPPDRQKERRTPANGAWQCAASAEHPCRLPLPPPLSQPDAWSL